MPDPGFTTPNDKKEEKETLGRNTGPVVLLKGKTKEKPRIKEGKRKPAALQ